MSRKLFGIFSGNDLAAMFGFVVLAIAVPGTLWAVATQLVTITNPGTGVAAIVNAEGYLLTQGVPGVPKFPLTGDLYVAVGNGNEILSATRGTAALTSITFTNFLNNVPSTASIYQSFSSTNSCSGDRGSRLLLRIMSPALGSFENTFPSPLVLKPSGNLYWCLTANVSIKDNPTAFYLPDISYNGFILNGTVTGPGAAMLTKSAAGAPAPKHN